MQRSLWTQWIVVAQLSHFTSADLFVSSRWKVGGRQDYPAITELSFASLYFIIVVLIEREREVQTHAVGAGRDLEAFKFRQDHALRIRRSDVIPCQRDLLSFHFLLVLLSLCLCKVWWLAPDDN